MNEDNIGIRESFWGATLVTMEDGAGMEHHWWFDQTDDGRWVCVAEVIQYDDNSRHYVDVPEVPDIVEMFLETEHGVEKIHYANDYR